MITAIISIILFLGVAISSLYSQYQNRVQIFPTQNIKVKIDSVWNEGDDSWSISGKTKAPDGSLIAVYDPKTADKTDIVNFDYGPVKNGKFKVNVSGDSLTDNNEIKDGKSISLIVVAISNIKVEDDDVLTIPEENVNDIKKNKTNATLNVNNNIQNKAADAESKMDDQVNKTLKEAQQPSKSLQGQVNEALSNKLRQRKEESSSSENMLGYISSMLYLKNDDGTVGIRINFTDTTNLSNNQRYKIAVKGQQIARQALNSMQNSEVNEKFKLTYDNGHLPYVEAGDRDNLAYISDPSTHVIVH